MRNFKLNAFAFVVFALALGGCKKEGCTDKDATNYSSEAKKDDGSCSFSGRAVMWYGEEASNELDLIGVTSLTFKVDGEIVGSTNATVYWTSAPSCGDNGSITITKNLANVKNKSYTYSVVDQDGFELWSGVLNFTANSCEAVELVV